MAPIQISLLIPTYNRYDALEVSLRAYVEQTVPPDQFEIVVISDGPEFSEQTRNAIRSFGKLNIRHLESGRSGPGGARNRALDDPSPLAELILITGDDIVPDARFIEAHLEFHRQYPAENTGAVGYTTVYSPDGNTPDFMEWLDRETDIQFGYHALSPGQQLPFNYFYTSNVSLKRRMIGGDRFDTDFRHGGWEDMDMGYRLMKRGFHLTYLPAAVGRHNHLYTLDAYVRRSRIMGWYEMMFYARHPELPAPSPLRDFAARLYHRLRLAWLHSPRTRYRSQTALARLDGHTRHRLGLPPE